MTKIVQPEYKKEHFNCLHCGVLSSQNWSGSCHKYHFSMCCGCDGITLWEFDDAERSTATLVYPQLLLVPEPNEDMPEDIKEIYYEAESILYNSPRASTALLRYAIDQLTRKLVLPEDKNKDLDKRIEILKDGDPALPEVIVNSLHTLRVIGNNALHSLEIDFNEDGEKIAPLLFPLVNAIVEYIISKPKFLKNLQEQINDTLPEATKKKISKAKTRPK